MTEIGHRVIAVGSSNTRGTKFFGYGVYVGYLSVPPGTETCLGTLEVPFRNPCIVLDSGAVVWGAQCWWGTIASWNRNVDPNRPSEQVDPPANPPMSDSDIVCATALLPGDPAEWIAKIREMAAPVGVAE